MHSITKLSFINISNTPPRRKIWGNKKRKKEKSEIKSQYYKEHDSHEVNHLNLRLFSSVTSCYLLNKTPTPLRL